MPNVALGLVVCCNLAIKRCQPFRLMLRLVWQAAQGGTHLHVSFFLYVVDKQSLS